MGASAIAIQAEPFRDHMAAMARRIIDAICRHPTMMRQEQTKQLAVLERAMAMAKGAEERMAVLQSHVGLLQSLSRSDFLTGIGNRRALEEHLRGVLAAAASHGDTGTLVLIDIDHFKDVND